MSGFIWKRSNAGKILWTNITSLPNIAGFYKEILLEGDADFCTSQLFLDLTVRGVEVGVYSHEMDKFHKFIDEVFVEAHTENVEHAIRNQMKEQLKARHTPFHRAATFMKHLKDQDAVKSIDRIKAQLPEGLKSL